MAREVMFYHSRQAGAPFGNGSYYSQTKGSIFTILYACLVSGFNAQPITTITQSGGTATALMGNAGHGFQAGEVFEISGVTPAGYNGRWEIDSVSGANVYFTVPTSLAATGSGGSMQAKYGAAGWTMPYASTVAGTGGVLMPKAPNLGIGVRIDDNGTEPDSDVTNIGPASFSMQQMLNPTGFDAADQMGEFAYHPKMFRGNYVGASGDSSANYREWSLVADGKTCYLILHGIIDVTGYQGSTTSVMVAFGQFNPVSSSDAYAFFNNRGKAASATTYILRATSYNSYGIEGVNRSSPSIMFPNVAPNISNDTDNTFGLTFMRSYNGLPGPAFGYPMAMTRFYGNPGGAPQSQAVADDHYAWPNIDPINNGLPLTPYFLVEKPTNIRGRLRGISRPLGMMPTSMFSAFPNNQRNWLKLPKQTIDGVEKQILLMRVGYWQYGNIGTDYYPNQQIAFDLSETWA